MSTNIHNPYAPPAVQGIANPGESDLSFSYVYDVALLANQVLQGQIVPIDSDSDFILRGVYYSWPLGTTGPFLLRLYDAQNFARSNGMLYSTNFSNDPSAPTVVSPELVYPAGGRLSLDIVDASGAPNTVELVFVGVKRFRVG